MIRLLCSSTFRRASTLFLPLAISMQAQQSPLPSDTRAPRPALRLDIPHSYNPLRTYLPTEAPAPSLENSARLDSLIRDGKLYLSLKDAIALAIENNLDLAIARYNIPIAAADVLRTQAGGSFRGVNTGVVQNTPGGGVGGFGSGGAGAGAGGTSGGAGGAGTGASGLVQSTLGTGTAVQSYDPAIAGTFSVEHFTEPLSNIAIYGVQSLQSNTTIGDVGYTQAFPTGTVFSFGLDNDRATSNSPYSYLNPTLGARYQVALQQQLLAGFGPGPNLRYLRIAKNNQKISDAAFKLQVISTVTQIANMYWDLVSAYEDEQVKQRSLDYAQQMLVSGRKQLELQAIPAMDVLKAEGEAAAREQDLSIARTALQFQELLIKNALTKNLDSSVLEAMPVEPVDQSSAQIPATGSATEDAIDAALRQRIELSESNLDLVNRTISRKAADNALLPTVALTASYAGTGLAGLNNPAAHTTSTAPTDFGGALGNSFNNSSPDYYVGLSVDIPLRNRIAKSDQYRSELEYRQAGLRQQQLKKQIRIEVRNAQYALQQSLARVEAARKSRDLAQKSFDISQQEQALGAGSNLQTSTARRDLATAESALVAALTAQQKAAVEVYRAAGSTLGAYNISIESAQTGVAQQP